MRMSSRFCTLGVLLVSLALSGCPKGDKAADAGAKPTKTTKNNKPTKKPAKKKVERALAECAAPRSTTPSETIELSGGKKLLRRGSTVQLTPDDADDELVIGHLTDVKDYSEKTAANLDIALKWFDDQAIDIIAVSGDLGESVDSIQGVLEHLAKSKLPVLAIIGNRECRAHFTEAAAAAQERYPNVINMNVVRVFNADDASVISLPGYYNKTYIHCAEGCAYYPADVEALANFAEDATGTVNVLLSHGPPRQSGAKALDRIYDNINVGDPEITKLIKTGKFPFGLFGNVQEAGGYATDLSGTKRIDQGAYANSLYLNPGPIDHVRWEMLDDTESIGMAGILRIKGKQASHKIYRIKPGEAKKR